MTDEICYRRYLDGDETGLEELIKKYGSPLTIYIYAHLSDILDAEDLMIEVFSNIFAKKPSIPDGGFKVYLYKSARQMALCYKSKCRPAFRLDELYSEPEGKLLIEEVVKTEERNRILYFCMEQLNPIYREAVYLIYFEGLSYHQAADVMSKSEKLIKNMIYQGDKNLRELFGQEEINNAEQ